LLVSEKYHHFDERIIGEEIDRLIKHITKDYIKLKLTMIKKDLQRSEISKDTYRRTELLTLQKQYIQQLPK